MDSISPFIPTQFKMAAPLDQDQSEMQSKEIEGLCLMSSPSLTPLLKNILIEKKLLDPSRRLKLINKDNEVAIPITSPSTHMSEEELIRHLKIKLKEISPWDVDVSELCLKKIKVPRAKKFCIKSPKMVLKIKLKQFFTEKGMPWEESIEKEVPNSWEKHGDLILIPSSAFTSPVWYSFGSEVWRCVAESLGCCRLAQNQRVSTDGYRTPHVTLLYGDTSWVQHIDNGVRYEYDITRCMFSAGNITEKLRVAQLDCCGDVVVDLYAGVGYFTLPYLVHAGAEHVHACEWNPAAAEALRHNLSINGVAHRCTVYEGDCRQVCPQGIADRVNLGLIPSSREGWPVACAALKPGTGGILHIHNNVNTRPGQVKDTDCSQGPVEAFRQEDRVGHHIEQNDFFSDKANVSHELSGSTKDKTDCNESVTELTNDKPDTETRAGDSCSCTINSKEENVILPTMKNVTEAIKGDETDLHKLKSSKWFPWGCRVAAEIRTMLETCHGGQWMTKILRIVHVKSYAPHVDHVVLDLQCQPCDSCDS